MKLAKSDRAFQVTEELRKIALSVTAHAYRIGELLKEVRDEKHWEKLDYKSFKAYYADFGFKKTRVYDYIAIAENFTFGEIKGVYLTKLSIIVPFLTEGNKEQLLEKAGALTISDLIHEVRGLEPKDEVEKERPLPKIYRCNVCYKIKGVSFYHLCHCGLTKKQIQYIAQLIDRLETGGDV